MSRLKLEEIPLTAQTFCGASHTYPPTYTFMLVHIHRCVVCTMVVSGQNKNRETLATRMRFLINIQYAYMTLGILQA